LNDLISPLSPLGINDLYSSPMFSLFGGLALLPPIKHDSEMMIFAMSVPR
jgi:hypothetical protein